MRCLRSRLSHCAILLSAAAPVLCAAEASDPLVVTASPVADAGPAIEPGPTVGLDRDQINDAPTIGVIGDAVNHLPGVYMDGPAGRNKETHLRGLGPEFSRVTVGGLDVPDGDETRQFQLDRLSPFAVESVTVDRNQSAAIESDGLAGRVDIGLRPIPAQRTEEAAAGVGFRDRPAEEGGYRASLAFSDRPNEVVGYQFFADLQRLPLNKEKHSTSYKANGTVSATSDSGGPTPMILGDVFGDIGVFHDGSELHLLPLFLSTWEDKPKATTKQKVGKDPTIQDEDEHSTATTIGAALTSKRVLESGAGWENAAAAYRSKDHSHKDKLDYTVSGGVPDLDDNEVEDETVNDRTLQYKGDGYLPLRTALPMRLQGGVQVRSHSRDHAISTISTDTSGVATDASEARYNYELSEWYYAAYVQDTFTPAAGLAITPGVRGELTALSTVSGSGERGTASTADLNPSLGLRYAPTARWELHAAASRTLARPEFDQLTPFDEEEDDRFTRGNPQLTPTWAWSYDVGGSWHETDTAQVGINLFYRDVHDLIESADTGTQQAGLPVFEYRNVGDGYARGVELDQRLSLGDVDPKLAPVTLWANQAFIDSRVRAADGDRPFQLQPHVISNFGFDLDLPSGTGLSVAAKYLGTRSEYDVGERSDYAGEWTLDVAVRQRLGSHFTLVLSAVNLTGNDTRSETYDTTTGALTSRDVECDFRYYTLVGEARF